MGKKRITLILGNGFDLDLGLKTSLRDFMNPENGFKPRSIEDSKLSLFLSESGSCEVWGGLELALEHYATCNALQHTYKEDVNFFRSIVECFRLYLHRTLFGAPDWIAMEKGKDVFNDEISINKESVAAYLCDWIIRGSFINNIITFNYTDIFTYTEQLLKECLLKDDLDVNPKYKDSITRIFVHREDERNRLVLGISSDAVLSDRRYRFLKKNRQSSIPNLFKLLIDADAIIFFGISFSKPDHTYFKEFFNEISKAHAIECPRNIFIVSKDDSSYEKCLTEIEIMLGGDLSGLINHNRVIQVNTDRGVDSYGFTELANEIQIR